MANIQQKIQEYWGTRRPEQQFRIKAGGALALFLVAAWLGSSAVQRAHPKSQDVSNSQTILLGSTAKLNAAEQQQRIDALTQQVNQLNKIVSSSAQLTKDQVASLVDQARKESAQSAPPQAALSPAGQAQIEALQAQIQALQNQIAAKPLPEAVQPAMPSMPAAMAPAGAAGVIELGGSSSSSGVPSSAPQESSQGVPPPPVAPPGVGQVNAQAPKGVAQGLGRIGGQPEQAGSLSTEDAGPVKVNSHDEAYLPPGTILTGVTLNGINVGTGPQAQSNPQIVEIRIKKPAIMPNGFRVNLNNCMIIATGFGSLPAQRVYLRPTTMSCVGPGGAAIESAIKGYVVGDDGISGMRGVVVSHQGELLEKGFFAGMLSGLGSAFQPQTVSSLAINPGSTTQYQYPSPSSVVGNSIGSGVNNAAGMIAKFYIDQAQQLQPTLQVNPGVSVDIILEQGARVRKKGMTRSELARVAWEAASAGSSNAPSSAQDEAAQAISKVEPAAPSRAAAASRQGSN
jgi:conjugal transfer pilus assembly protein TraB